MLLTCRVRDEESEQRVAQAQAQGSQDVLPQESSGEAKQQPKACTAQELPKLNFAGEIHFGALQQKILLSLKDFNTSHRITAEIDKQNIQLDATGLTITDIDVQTICSQPLVEGNRVPINAGSPFLTAVMERLAPDCQFETSGGGTWDCVAMQHDPTVSPQASLTNLDQQILRKWNRHPYLLTRRFTTTKQLARILNNKETGAARSGLCQLLHIALKDELPLALRSPTAQQLLCQDTEKEFKAVGPFILNAAVKELDFLASKFSSDSQSGALTVQLPVRHDGTQSRRDFWVSLQAISYGNEHPPTTTAEQPQPQSLNLCWNPLLIDTIELAPVAVHLGLIQPEQHKYCSQTLGDAHKKAEDPQRYIAASITSESEFIITYGKTKLLRLPEGNYEYVVKKQMNLIESFSQTAEPAISKGTLSWKRPTTRTIIK